MPFICPEREPRRQKLTVTIHWPATLALAALMYASACWGQVSPPNFSNPGYSAPLNPFDQWGANWYECTRYAWGRAYEKTGVQVTFTVSSGRDGGRWYDLVTSSFQRGAAPQPNSFAVWSNGPGQTGHVAFVELVDSQNVTVTEANLDLQGHYAGATAIPLSRMQVGGNRSGYGLGSAYTLVGYVYLQTSGSTISVGAGATADIAAKFQAAYSLEASNLGNPTGPVTPYTDSFYSPSISGYYQNFRDSSGRNMSLQLISGASQAYSVKWGFADLYATVASYNSNYHVYDLVVAPTANESPAGPSSPSVAGTQYTWQPFLKGAMYYFNSGGFANQGWQNTSEYVWGEFSDRYNREGGRGGLTGLPVQDAKFYPTTDGWLWWYQFFERGFIWRAQSTSGGPVWTYAFRYTTDVTKPNGQWIDSALGWVQH